MLRQFRICSPSGLGQPPTVYGHRGAQEGLLACKSLLALAWCVIIFHFSNAPLALIYLISPLPDAGDSPPLAICCRPLWSLHSLRRHLAAVTAKSVLRRAEEEGPSSSSSFSSFSSFSLAQFPRREVVAAPSFLAAAPGLSEPGVVSDILWRRLCRGHGGAQRRQGDDGQETAPPHPLPRSSLHFDWIAKRGSWPVAATHKW